jgi:diguanylate cyclase (GGDEF)-like protein
MHPEQGYRALSTVADAGAAERSLSRAPDHHPGIERLGVLTPTVAAVAPAAAAYRQVLGPALRLGREELDASSVSAWLWTDLAGAHTRLISVSPDNGVIELGGLPADRPVGRPYLLDENQTSSHSGSALGMPLWLEERIWGELVFTRTPRQPPFVPSDLQRAQVLAERTAEVIAPLAHLKALADLAFTDALTGVANRRAVDEVLSAAVQRHRTDGVVLSLIIADVNGLKQINDDSGHDAGDRALAHFADILTDAAALAPGSLPARLGGDEFCIILEGYDADAAALVAHEVCQRAAADRIGDGAACGIASTSEPIGDVSTPARLFALADSAQSLAKRSSTRDPVIAGRDLSPEAAAGLGAAAAPAPGSAPRRRRSQRGAATADRISRQQQALGHVLHALDSSSARQPLERLEMVAESVCRLIDGCSWWVSATDASQTWLTTVSRSVLRKTNGQVDPELTGERSGSYLLEDWPATVEVMQGRATVIEAADPTADPNEVEMLHEVGYTAVLMAGALDAGGRGWLIEIYVDSVSLAPAPFANTLRALTACALVGPLDQGIRS